MTSRIDCPLTIDPHRQSQRIPAPMVRAMAARSVRAQVKRKSLRLHAELLPIERTLHSWAGNRAVSERSLALRPRLATGLPVQPFERSDIGVARDERYGGGPGFQ